MVRLNRIYTKAGDGGDTRLVGGQKVRKDALRIEAYGTVDELSACIGIARTALTAPRRARGGGRARAGAGAHPERALQPGQRSGDAARRSPPEAAGDRGAPRDRAGARDRRLERDAARAAQLRAARAAAWSPRTCTSRARSAAAPSGTSSACATPSRSASMSLPYVNRLSDALFVMSRHAARLYGEPEPLWEPEKT